MKEKQVNAGWKFNGYKWEGKPSWQLSFILAEIVSSEHWMMCIDTSLPGISDALVRRRCAREVSGMEGGGVVPSAWSVKVGVHDSLFGFVAFLWLLCSCVLFEHTSLTIDLVCFLQISTRFGKLCRPYKISLRSETHPAPGFLTSLSFFLNWGQLPDYILEKGKRWETLFFGFSLLHLKVKKKKRNSPFSPPSPLFCFHRSQCCRSHSRRYVRKWLWEASEDQCRSRNRRVLHSLHSSSQPPSENRLTEGRRQTWLHRVPACSRAHVAPLLHSAHMKRRTFSYCSVGWSVTRPMKS